MNEKASGCKCLLVIKIRGSISAQREARETLELLCLSRRNHAVLVENNSSMTGMLRRVQSYVTWGEISNENIAALLSKRGKLVGGHRLTEEYVRRIGYESMEELAAAISTCKVAHRNLPGVQPLFKLHPPKKGFKGKIKKSYRADGEAGYRGTAINELAARMM